MIDTFIFQMDNTLSFSYCSLKSYMLARLVDCTTNIKCMVYFYNRLLYYVRNCGEAESRKGEGLITNSNGFLFQASGEPRQKPTSSQNGLLHKNKSQQDDFLETSLKTPFFYFKTPTMTSYRLKYADNIVPPVFRKCLPGTQKMPPMRGNFRVTGR